MRFSSRETTRARLASVIPTADFTKTDQKELRTRMVGATSVRRSIHDMRKADSTSRDATRGYYSKKCSSPRRPSTAASSGSNTVLFPPVKYQVRQLIGRSKHGTR